MIQYNSNSLTKTVITWAAPLKGTLITFLPEQDFRATLLSSVHHACAPHAAFLNGDEHISPFKWLKCNLTESDLSLCAVFDFFFSFTRHERIIQKVLQCVLNFQWLLGLKKEVNNLSTHVSAPHGAPGLSRLKPQPSQRQQRGMMTNPGDELLRGDRVFCASHPAVKDSISHSCLWGPGWSIPGQKSILGRPLRGQDAARGTGVLARLTALRAGLRRHEVLQGNQVLLLSF